MQKNYIILAHKNPQQLKRLVEKLNDVESSFYLHIDKTVDIGSFTEVLSVHSNIKFIKKREEGTWGDIGIVKATINSMKEVIADTNQGYCILLSGQDYPIKSSEKINSYLNKGNSREFIDISPLDNVVNTKEWKAKLSFYKYNFSNKKGDYIILPSFFSMSFFTIDSLKSIGKIIIKKNGIKLIPTIFSNLFKKRVPPESILPFAGGQWWALTNDTTRKIIAFTDQNQDYLEHHRFTLLPDEIFFQSVLMHLINQGDGNIKFGKSLTYINWSRKNCDLPVTFKSADIEELITQPEGMLFARKFDFDVDRQIFDAIDGFISL